MGSGLLGEEDDLVGLAAELGGVAEPVDHRTFGQEGLVAACRGQSGGESESVQLVEEPVAIARRLCDPVELLIGHSDAAAEEGDGSEAAEAWVEEIAATGDCGQEALGVEVACEVEEEADGGAVAGVLRLVPPAEAGGALEPAGAPEFGGEELGDVGVVGLDGGGSKLAGLPACEEHLEDRPGDVGEVHVRHDGGEEGASDLGARGDFEHRKRHRLEDGSVLCEQLEIERCGGHCVHEGDDLERGTLGLRGQDGEVFGDQREEYGGVLVARGFMGDANHRCGVVLPFELALGEGAGCRLDEEGGVVDSEGSCSGERVELGPCGVPHFLCGVLESGYELLDHVRGPPGRGVGSGVCGGERVRGVGATCPCRSCRR